MTLDADGKAIGSGEIPRTMGSRFSLSETFDVGLDSTTPVSPRYRSPAVFAGTLTEVRLQVDAGSGPVSGIAGDPR